MRESTTSFLFPDLNVWLALSYDSHSHHRVAVAWFDALPDSARLCFCRITQMGLLRLLTTEQIMTAEVLTQRQAWQVYDRWLEDNRVVFVDEPADLESAFREVSQMERAAPKGWVDSYLTAFAGVSGFRIVTFDKALSKKASGAVLLRLE